MESGIRRIHADVSRRYAQLLETFVSARALTAQEAAQQPLHTDIELPIVAGSSDAQLTRVVEPT